MTGVLPKQERDYRIQVIGDHMREFHELRRRAHSDLFEVESWTLPAAWDPGEDPGVGLWPVDVPVPPSKLMGVPVRFEGDQIVAHLTPWYTTPSFAAYTC